jgi:hypothetical protein
MGGEEGWRWEGAMEEMKGDQVCQYQSELRSVLDGGTWEMNGVIWSHGMERDVGVNLLLIPFRFDWTMK